MRTSQFKCNYFAIYVKCIHSSTSDPIVDCVCSVYMYLYMFTCSHYFYHWYISVVPENIPINRRRKVEISNIKLSFWKLSLYSGYRQLYKNLDKLKHRVFLRHRSTSYCTDLYVELNIAILQCVVDSDNKIILQKVTWQEILKST